MLAALIPLFDENMTVCAYSLFAQKENLLQEPRYVISAQHDGAYTIRGLEVIESMGMHTISPTAKVFVPISNVSLFVDIENQCSAEHERIVLFIDNSVKPTDMYVKRISELRGMGYQFAMGRLGVDEYEAYRNIVSLMDYIVLNSQAMDVSKAKIYFKKVYPKLSIIVGNIPSQDRFEELRINGYELYEGAFYRVPVTKGKSEIAPLKLNYLELINIVNGPNFDLSDAADVIGRDTALAISLLDIVNRLSRNSEIKSLKHATAMLGQKELKRWILTVVTKELCVDKPNEITRLSLIRAKFAENLADAFGLQAEESDLFFMGLFSVLDIILDVPMSQAIEMITVPNNIKSAYIDGSGELACVMRFMLDYEKADWLEVSKVQVLKGLDMDKVYEAYCQAYSWYRDMFFAR